MHADLHVVVVVVVVAALGYRRGGMLGTDRTTRSDSMQANITQTDYRQHKPKTGLCVFKLRNLGLNKAVPWVRKP